MNFLKFYTRVLTCIYKRRCMFVHYLTFLATEHSLQKSWLIMVTLLLSSFQKESSGSHSALLPSSIDQGPYLNVADGMVAAMGNDPTDGAIIETSDETNRTGLDTGNHEVTDSRKPDSASFVAQTSEEGADSKGSSIVERCLYQISRQNKRSIWLLAYVAILSTWPIVGAALGFFYKKKIKRALQGKTA